MENKGFDFKKIIIGIVFIVAIALGIIHPSDFLSSESDSTAETAEIVQSIVAEDETEQEETEATTASVKTEASYVFRNNTLLQQHYEKHGIDMGFDSAEEYEKAASAVVTNPNALHKTEAEDGDDVYYIESTNEFVIVSKDGYLRTYFEPSRGIDYYNAQ